MEEDTSFHAQSSRDELQQKKNESTKSRFTKGDAEGRRGGGGKNNDEDNKQGDDERSRCR